MGGFGLFPRQRPAMCSEYLRAVPAIMKGLKPRNLMGHDIACSWIVIGPDRRRAPRCTIYINSFGATEEINEGIPLNSQRFLVCLVVYVPAVGFFRGSFPVVFFVFPLLRLEPLWESYRVVKAIAQA